MSEQHFQEPEEKGQDNQPLEFDFNPLDEPVNEKSYSRPNVRLKPEDMAQPIPEPIFTPPPMPEQESGPETPPKPPPPPLNSEMPALPKKERQTAATHLANTIMSGYEFLHIQGNNLLQFSERKMKKLHKEGAIDLTAPIPYNEEGDMCTVKEFMQEFNAQNGQALQVSPEFKEEVMPILVRVLEKRGAGMTDEQMLIFLFGKDLTYKGIQFIGIKAQMREMINNLKEHTEVLKANGYGAATAPPPPPPPQEQPTYQPPPSPPPAPSPGEEFTANALVIKMTDPDGYAQRQQELEAQQQQQQEEQPKKTGRRSKEEAEKARQERLKKYQEGENDSNEE